MMLRLGRVQRTTFIDAAGTYYHYTYDPIGQLKVGDSSVNTEDRGYLYDAAWNLTQRTNNGAVSTLIYDNKNEVTNAFSGTYTYDANGNPTYFNSSGSKSYSYDDENRLTSVSMVATWRSDFTYDGPGRMRTRLEYTWNGSSWILNTTTYYIYDGMRVIQERTSSPTVSYTRGPDLSGTMEGAGGIGGLLARSSGYSSGNWTAHHFYHADGNGNITYLVDSSQALAASYRYDPFGNTISSSGTLASANVYRFSSREVHVNSGMYYYGYRFYDPNLQRWLNRDPLGDEGFPKPAIIHASRETFDRNLYWFVANNPLGYRDYLGLDSPGCDLPDQVNPSKWECMTRQKKDCLLSCCAQHDGCYYKHNCSRSSWKWTWLLNWLDGLVTTACQECNNDVVSCFAQCALGGPPRRPRWFCSNGRYAGRFYDDYSEIPASCWANGLKPSNPYGPEPPLPPQQVPPPGLIFQFCRDCHTEALRYLGEIQQHEMRYVRTGAPVGSARERQRGAAAAPTCRPAFGHMPLRRLRGVP